LHTERLVGPTTLLGQQLATCVTQGSRQHGTPTGDVVEGDADRMLHKPRHARGRTRLDERADAVELAFVEGDRDLPGRHTHYHTHQVGEQLERFAHLGYPIMGPKGAILS